tara:strand:+ start:53 stop:388 length:336 start_codon:yes stop_codon:yes gene_type:complete
MNEKEWEPTEADLREPSTPEGKAKLKKEMEEMYEQEDEISRVELEKLSNRVERLNSKSYTNELLEENNKLLLANAQSSLEINKTLIWIMAILILILCVVVVLAYDIQPWWK